MRRKKMIFSIWEVLFAGVLWRMLIMPHALLEIPCFCWTGIFSPSQHLKN